jgi:hypothetical protein
MSQVAQTILQQLGGNRFAALTGANSFVAGEYDLTMRLPRGKGMRIKLNAMDTYDIDYFAIRGTEVKDLGHREGIYCDMLQDTFEELTGLYVTLFPRKVA